MSFTPVEIVVLCTASVSIVVGGLVFLLGALISVEHADLRYRRGQTLLRWGAAVMLTAAVIVYAILG